MPNRLSSAWSRHWVRAGAMMSLCLGLLVTLGCREDDPVSPEPFEAEARPDTATADSSASDSLGQAGDSLLAAATGTTINPGQSIQASVNAYPTGTTFRLTAGVHRLQSVSPKSGQTFVGDPGAIVSGGKVLTGWSSNGSRWFVGGQTQRNTSYTSRTCESGYAACNLPEQLWIDGVLQKRQTSLSAVGSGSWYFDYDADRIYIGTNPSGRTVETSVTPQAFRGSASNVTIRGLTIEKYATGSGYGTIDANSGWIVEDVDVGDSHGACIRVNGSNVKIRGSKIHHCGEQGIGGSAGSGLLIYGNEISYHNTAGFGAGNGDNRAAGIKVSRTKAMVIRKNNVHHNPIGMWCDMNCVDAVYDSNTVVDNYRRGIQYEIGYGCTISNNTIRRNGLQESGPSAAGIWIAQSSDCEIFRNTLEDNRNSVIGSDRPRGSGPLGPYLLENMYVHHNTVRQSSVYSGGVNDQHSSHDPYSSKSNNRWVSNTYGGTLQFMWTGNKTVGWSQWQAAGQY